MSISSRNPHQPDLSLPVSEVAIYRTLCITELPSWEDDEPTLLRGPLAILDAFAPAPDGVDEEAAEEGEEDEDEDDGEGAADAGGEADEGDEKPASPPPEPERDGPAEGVLLTYEQAWRVKGVALGRLHHSLCLAPGEVTQIAVSDWSRTTTGSATEEQAASEMASKSVGRQRHSTMVTEAVANERQAASSSMSSISSSTSAGGGGAFGLWGFSASASHNHSVGHSAEYQVGVRNVAASSLNDVRQSTHQQVSSVRQRTASLVQEVTETESETSMTRVVANYNHMHALNMQYYEVVQVYELSSRVTAADRCIFVPMHVMAFDTSTVEAFAEPLMQAAMLLRRPVLVHALQRVVDPDSDPEPDLKTKAGDAETARDNKKAEVETAAKDVAAAEAAETAAQDAVTSAKAAEEATKPQGDAGLRLKGLHEAAKKLPLPMPLPGLDDLPRLRALLDMYTVFSSLPLQRASAGLRKQHRAMMAALDALGDKTPDQAIDDHASAKTALHDAQVALEAAQKSKRAAETRRDHLTAELTPLQVAHDKASKALKDATDGRALDTAALNQALNDHRLWFNQWLWQHMTPAQTASLLQRHTLDGTPLIEQVEPTVIGIQDHYIAFRRPFDRGQRGERLAFERRFLGTIDREGARETVALPTGGLFAEAVLGTSNAAEKLDLTRFWKWDDDTIPILPTAIQSLRQRQRERLEEARPSDATPSSLQVEDLPDLPPPARPALGAAVSAPLFRDLADPQRIADVLAKTLEEAGSLDTEAQAEAQRNVKAYQEHLVKLLPIAQKALAQGADLDPSSLGALANVAGEGELDVGALLGTAARLGLLL